MSKPVVVNVPHDLGRAEARRRLEEGFVRVGQQIGGKALAFEQHWVGEQLQFKAGAFGQKVSGRVDIFDKTIRVEVDLPWILASIAHSIQGRIQKESTLLLGKK